MKFSKIFLLFSIILIAGCNSQRLENSEITQNNNLNNKFSSDKSAERLAYTEDTLRLLSGEFNVSNTENQTTLVTINPNILSSYSTPILSTDENRYNNIKIVADKLNNLILQPNEGFSFNDRLGPYGKNDGFLEAKILLSNGEESTGYGGGVCQLSTTLYNAVKKLEDIKITEHHNHSVPVAYAPKNQDATVSLQSRIRF